MGIVLFPLSRARLTANCFARARPQRLFFSDMARSIRSDPITYQESATWHWVFSTVSYFEGHSGERVHLQGNCWGKHIGKIWVCLQSLILYCTQHQSLYALVGRLWKGPGGIILSEFRYILITHKLYLISRCPGRLLTLYTNCITVQCSSLYVSTNIWNGCGQFHL